MLCYAVAEAEDSVDCCAEHCCRSVLWPPYVFMCIRFGEKDEGRKVVTGSNEDIHALVMSSTQRQWKNCLQPFHANHQTALTGHLYSKARRCLPEANPAAVAIHPQVRISRLLASGKVFHLIRTPFQRLELVLEAWGYTSGRSFEKETLLS